MDCVLNIYTPTSPLISGDCRGLSFAPHNAPHPSLLRNMVATGLVPSEGAVPAADCNMWDRSMVMRHHSSHRHAGSLGNGAGAGGAGHDASPFEVAKPDGILFKYLPPKDFFLVSVPSITVRALVCFFFFFFGLSSVAGGRVCRSLCMLGLCNRVLGRTWMTVVYFGGGPVDLAGHPCSTGFLRAPFARRVPGGPHAPPHSCAQDARQHQV